MRIRRRDSSPNWRVLADVEASTSRPMPTVPRQRLNPSQPPTTVPKGGSGRGGEQPGHRRAPGRHDRASTATACLACPNGHNQADQRLLLVGAAQDAKQTVQCSSWRRHDHHAGAGPATHRLYPRVATKLCRWEVQDSPRCAS